LSVLVMECVWCPLVVLEPVSYIPRNRHRNA
jgi:hypothetical protein